MKIHPVAAWTASFALIAGVALAQTPRTAVPPKTPPGGVPPRTLTPRPAPPGAGARSDQPAAPKIKGPSSVDDPYAYPLGDRVDKVNEIVTMQGNARILYKDTKFASDKVVYNEDNQVGSAPGKLQIDDAQNTITGDRGEALYKTKVARIIGGVKIVARPKPTDDKVAPGSMRREFKSPVTITCDTVQYNWKTRVADPNGHIVIHCTIQGHNWTFTADKLQYNGRTETAKLTGNVHGVSDRNEDIKATAVTLVVTEGAETMEAFNYDGRHIVDDEDTKDDKPASAPKPNETKPAETKPGEVKPTLITP